jgi:ribonuclease HII
MSLALDRLDPRPQHALIDGLRIRWLAYPHTALVEGDCRSYSIAAASVLAKVTRDRRMTEYDQLYPAYGFAEHKGYGTPRHLAAILTHGPCPIHRRTFAPFRPVQPELLPDLETGASGLIGPASVRGGASLQRGNERLAS